VTDFAEVLRRFDAGWFVLRHGGRKESRSPTSSEYLLPCPCGSSRLRWNSEKGAFRCWGCRRDGGTLDLVQLLEQCDLERAVEVVAASQLPPGAAPTVLGKVGLVRRVAGEVLRRLPPMRWPREAELLDPSAPVHADAWAYWRSRGLGVGEARVSGVSFARRGRLAGRLVLPVRMDGAVVYYQARSIGDDAQPKVLNPSSREAEATASEVLYGYDLARGSQHVVVVEGLFDALRVGPHAVALLGKTASPAKVERLRRMSATRYTVYLDRGDEERREARRLASLLAEWAPTFVAEPPEGYDAGSLDRARNAEVVAAAVPVVPGGGLEGVSAQ
jgi:hypothetical protein